MLVNPTNIVLQDADNPDGAQLPLQAVAIDGIPHLPITSRLPRDLGSKFTFNNLVAQNQTPTFITPGVRGLKIVLSLSAVAGASPTNIIKIQCGDAASNTAFDIVSVGGAAVVGQRIITLYPGITPGALSFNDVLCEVWRIVLIPGGAGVSLTGVVGVHLLA